MRILVIDDHAVVRKGVVDILSLTYTDAEFSEAESGVRAEELLALGTYDLVILDISLPGEDGFATLKFMGEQNPVPPVLVFSMHNGAGYMAKAFKLGARGYLSKASPPEEILTAAEAVLSGKRYVPVDMAANLVDVLLPQPGRLRLEQLLSEREYEVIVRLAHGEKVKEIAQIMCLSDKTVSTYRTRAMRKLDIKSLPQFFKFALKNGLMEA